MMSKRPKLNTIKPRLRELGTYLEELKRKEKEKNYEQVQTQDKTNSPR